MLVRILGISFEPKSIITMKDLFSYLNDIADERCEINNMERLVIVDQESVSKYFIGVVVTIKDQRRFCELAEEQGKMKIKVVNLKDRQSIMDFNFFVINKDSYLGLYQHYHQSCSIGQFAYLLSKRYREAAEQEIDDELEKSKGVTVAIEKRIKKKYAGKLSWDILVRKENLKNILLELQKIKSFEFDFMYLESKEPEYQPLRKTVRKERRKLTFIRNSPINFMAHEISKLANKLDLHDGRVRGEDLDGITRSIRIMDNPDNYGEYEYDDVALNLNDLDLDDINSSWVIKELLTIARKHKYIFESRAK